MKKPTRKQLAALRVVTLPINWCSEGDVPCLNAVTLLKLSGMRQEETLTVRLEGVLGEAMTDDLGNALGGPVRRMALVEETTSRGWRYWWADTVTGTLYRPLDGVCATSWRLRMPPLLAQICGGI